MEILQKGKETKASDIHLKAGTKPILRIDGILHSIGDEPISNEEIYQLLKTMLSVEQLEMLENKVSLTFPIRFQEREDTVSMVIDNATLIV